MPPSAYISAYLEKITLTVYIRSIHVDLRKILAIQLFFVFRWVPFACSFRQGKKKKKVAMSSIKCARRGLIWSDFIAVEFFFSSSAAFSEIFPRFLSFIQLFHLKSDFIHFPFFSYRQVEEKMQARQVSLKKSVQRKQNLGDSWGRVVSTHKNCCTFLHTLCSPTLWYLYMALQPWE